MVPISNIFLGLIIFEIGYEQGPAVKKYIENNKWTIKENFKILYNDLMRLFYVKRRIVK